MACRDIFEAVSNRNLTAVKHFVEIDGVDLSSKNKDGNTVAHIAAKNVDLSMVKYLCKKDLNVFFTRGVKDLTVTQLAIGIKSITLLKVLLDDCKIDMYRDGDSGYPGTCIHFAARVCSFDIFKYFIEEKNVDVNLLNNMKQPLAFAAAQGSCINIVKYIYETGKADLTVKDANGRDILCHSALNCDLMVPKYLLDEQKLNIDLNNTLVIQDAISYKKEFNIPSSYVEDFMKYFVEEKGVNINNNIPETPLHRAAKVGMLDIVEYLVRHGADVGRKDIFGHTPLQVASNKEVEKFLKEKEGNRTRRSLPASNINTRLKRSYNPELSTGHLSSASGSDVRDADVGSHYFHNILLLAGAFMNSKSHHFHMPSPRDTIRRRVDPIANDFADNNFGM